MKPSGKLRKLRTTWRMPSGAQQIENIKNRLVIFLSVLKFKINEQSEVRISERHRSQGISGNQLRGRLPSAGIEPAPVPIDQCFHCFSLTLLLPNFSFDYQSLSVSRCLHCFSLIHSFLLTFFLAQIYSYGIY